MTMRNSLLTVLGSVMLLGAALPAHSESVLRIGLALTRTCSTRIWRAPTMAASSLLPVRQAGGRG